MLAWLWFAGCARQGDLEALSARVETLEQEKAAAEQRLADIESSISFLENQQRPPSATPHPDERQAVDVLKRAVEASDSGDYVEARELVAQLASDFGETQAFRSGQRLAGELEIVGIPEVPLSVERWYRKDEASLRGHVTVYLFFEVWCPHCKREVPKLLSTYERYHEQGLEIVGITRLTKDTSGEALEAFLSENHINYPIAKDKDETMSNAYGVKGIPAAAVVKDGTVVWRGHPARITDAHIEGWL